MARIEHRWYLPFRAHAGRTETLASLGFRGLHPNELPPPRIDATNSSFGLGGRGRVIYEAVPQTDIPPLRWTPEGELRTVTEESLERGVLLTFDTGNGREFVGTGDFAG